MTDISKCGKESCKWKDSCYRYTAPSGHWQSWISPPEPKPDGSCRLYMPITQVTK